MNKRERLYKLKQLLDGHCALPAADLMARLGVSRATLTRDLDELGDILHATCLVRQGTRRLPAPAAA